MTDQADTIALLSKPSTYGADFPTVERIDTHASIIFLAGDRVFKLKRAVHYAFLDYSTLDLRRIFCEREVMINRRTAPQLYDGVMAVVQDDDGRLALGGVGTPVDYVVAMKRFDEAGLFSNLADAGALNTNLVSAAVDQVIALHEGAEQIIPASPLPSGTDSLRRTIADTASVLAEHGDVFGGDAVLDYAETVERCFTATAGLLQRRAAAGFVRRCHGDLHLANICTFDGQPTLFDAIEFSDAIACIDTLYDLAFLLMDLDERGLSNLANRAFNRYMAHISAVMATIEGTAALPLFLSVRAAIRAMVTTLSADRLKEDDAVAAEQEAALQYFNAARRYLEPSQPILFAIGGASGTGKSTVAMAMAPEIGNAPGALLLRTDEIRKQLAGLSEDARLPTSAYTAAHHQQVYGEMHARASASLAAGRSCIIDAVHGQAVEREKARQLAQRHGATFVGIWLQAIEARLLDRVATRRGDASDAGRGVVQAQLAEGFGDIDWVRIDAGRPLDRVIGDVRRACLRAVRSA